MERNHLFREKLREVLIDKTKKNPSFSLRAFAKQLGVESSSLSQIINGKRNLTDKMCERLAPKLNISPNELDRLMGNQNFAAKAKKIAYKKLSEDNFNIIADWYHYAILELTYVKGFKGDFKWISNVLGVNIHIVKAAVERLKRVGFLKIEKDGTWVDTIEFADALPPNQVQPAYRKIEIQKREMAIEAIDNIKPEERGMMSRTFAGDKKKIEEAKIRCREFLKELEQFLGDRSINDVDEVYHVTLSLYPVSQVRKGE